MTSPVSAIEAIEKTPNRIQGMVRSIDQYRNGRPKAVADGSYAQVLFALQDMRHDILVLWDFAVEAARQAEALQRENAEKDARIARLERALENAPDPQHFSILAEALAEVKATSDGQSDQPITDIIAGCLDEIDALSQRRARALLGGENAE